LYAAAPLVIIFAIWFAYPQKLISTWSALVNRPWGVENPFSIEGWVFYPRAFFNLSGSGWLFALLVTSLLAAIKFRQDKPVRFLVIFVFTQFFICQLHHTKLERHLFPILPALFLLAGHLTAECWARFRERNKKIQFWLPRVLTGVLLLHACSSSTTAMRPQPAERNRNVIDYIAKAVRETGTTLLLGTMDLVDPSPPQIDWQLTIEEQLIVIPQAGTVTQVEVERKLAAALPRWGAPTWVIDAMLPVLNRTDRPGMNRSLYLGIPANAAYSRDPDGLDAFLQDTLSRTSFDGIVVVSSLAGQARYPLSWTARGLQNAGMRNVSTRHFEDAAVRVDVFRSKR
jgi:hypothetical protein